MKEIKMKFINLKTIFVLIQIQMIFSFPFPPNLSSYQNYNLPQQKINYNNIEDMPLGISQTSFMSEVKIHFI